MNLRSKLKRPRVFKTRCFYCKQPLISKNARFVIYIIGFCLVSIYVLNLIVAFPMIKLFWLSQAIEVNNESLKSIVGNISDVCKDEIEWEQCAAYEAFNFVMSNVTYKEDVWYEEYFLLANGPEATIENGGDCENSGILMISILKSLNVTEQFYLVSQQDGFDGHVCVMIRHKMENTSFYYNQFYMCNSDAISAIYPI